MNSFNSERLTRREASQKCLSFEERRWAAKIKNIECTIRYGFVIHTKSLLYNNLKSILLYNCFVMRLEFRVSGQP